MSWSLATVDVNRAPVAVIEKEGKTYRLGAALERSRQRTAATLIDLFVDWDRMQHAIDIAAQSLHLADEVQFTRCLAPLLYPGKILCAGANYFDHLAEMGMPGAKKADQRLFFFMKPPRNAIVGEGPTVHMPLGTKAFDWEIELGAIIGTPARNVPVETALSHVAAYTIAIDFSARDHNRAPETFYKLDWVAGKANDTCCPIGPRIVPAHAIKNPQDLALKLAVNGVLKHNGTTRDMIFSIDEQIAIASRIMTLDPGDLLLTGTPAGVGVRKQTFLNVGDIVDAEIEGIGRLSLVIQPAR